MVLRGGHGDRTAERRTPVSRAGIGIRLSIVAITLAGTIGLRSGIPVALADAGGVPNSASCGWGRPANPNNPPPFLQDGIGRDEEAKANAVACAEEGNPNRP
jgi:hypothetical protein